MAVIGGSGGGVNDIYTDSTATVGTASVVAGESLKLSSTGELFPQTHQLMPQTERAVANIVQGSTETNYYNAAAGAQVGNPVMPDGRSIYMLVYSNGDAYAVVIEKDGSTRAGTTYVHLDQTGNTGTTQFHFYQLGQTTNSGNTHYRVGVVYRCYHNAGYYYQKYFILFVEKDSNSISSALGNMSGYPSYAATSVSYWNRYLTSERDVDNWKTCRGDTVDFYGFPKQSYAVGTYTFTAVMNYASTQGHNTYNENFYDTTDLAHTGGGSTYVNALSIVKIDDANGIFLVLHESTAGTQTLTKIVIDASAQITASTVATISSSYSGLNAAMTRTDVVMVGSGTGSNNLCFMRQASNISLQVQPCTYNSSTDALTWGTYVALDTPVESGVQSQWYTTDILNDATYRKRWTYSPATKKVYFSNMAVDKGSGLILDTQTSTLGIGRITQELGSLASDTTNITASVDGTSLIQMGDAPTYISQVEPWGVDNSVLVTSNTAAISREAGVNGETIDISLVDGITSASDLPSTYYLKKNDLFFPYTVYVDGSAVISGATSNIKSIQRGLVTVSASAGTTVTIDSVDLTKTSFNLSGGTNYNNTIGVSPWLDSITSSSFRVRTSNYSTSTGKVYWEVIEYV
jgi:hypothetical protein